jgi:NADH:ubiquinone oxidoreductase subunit F (NADH-binding)
VAAARGRPIVVVNGCEGEPASSKDTVLLQTLPHLVLDGAVLAASALGAHDVLVCVPDGSPVTRGALHGAIRERRDRCVLRIASVPERYVASEETALVQHLNGGPALPTFAPPRPFERGVGGRPTLVQNAETLAQVALLARHGSVWFRQAGLPEDPGTALVTVSGAVEAEGVYEVVLGEPLADVLAHARPSVAPRAILLGGCFGAWVTPEQAASLPLDHDHGLGAGVIVVLPQGACGVCETAAALRYLAAQSAGQCGPCVFGLGAIAQRLTALADGRASLGTDEQVRRWAAEVEGRGACRHPDGAIRLLRSALDVFAPEVGRHQRGARCAAGRPGAILGIPSTRRAA